MIRHIDFLGTLLLIWSALALLTGCACLLLAFGAAAIFGSATADGTADAVLSAVAAALFAAVGLGGMLLGGVHASAGVGLHRRRPWSRQLGLVLGSVDLIVFPFGSLLGAYALWVLLDAETRRVFRQDL